MAQIAIPDEQYQSLSALAHDRGVSPEQLLAALIEEAERADQLAFWGEDGVENVRRQMAATEASSRHLSEEHFFAELDGADARRKDERDADV